MGFLGRAALLKRDDLKVEKVELGGGDFVYVREMTGRERDNFERSLMREVKTSKGGRDYESNLQDFRAKIAVNTICDENGKLVLNPETDVEKLSQNISIRKLDIIVKRAQALNKISDEDKEALTKNSSGDPVANSTSGSV